MLGSALSVVASNDLGGRFGAPVGPGVAVGIRCPAVAAAVVVGLRRQHHFSGLAAGKRSFPELKACAVKAALPWLFGWQLRHEEALAPGFFRHRQNSSFVLFLLGGACFGCLLNRAQIHCAGPWHLEFSDLPPRSSGGCPAIASGVLTTWIGSKDRLMAQVRQKESSSSHGGR